MTGGIPGSGGNPGMTIGGSPSSISVVVTPMCQSTPALVAYWMNDEKLFARLVWYGPIDPELSMVSSRSALGCASWVKMSVFWPVASPLPASVTR